MFSLEMFPHLHYHYNKLIELGLPDNTAKYMSENGLPVLNGAGCGDIEAVVFFDESKLFLYNEKLVVIGMLFDRHYICINTENGGVYLINDGAVSDNLDDTEPPGLANSSLPLFVEFISIYYHYTDKYSAAFEDGDEAVVTLVTDKIEREFIKLDKPAMDDEESFWSVRVEELGYMI